MRKLSRCKWCVARVGRAQWYNERGSIVEVPHWEIPIETQTNDGICPECVLIEMEKIKRLNNNYEHPKTNRAIEAIG